MPKQQSLKDVLAENVIGEFEIPGIGNIIGVWLYHGNYRPTCSPRRSLHWHAAGGVDVGTGALSGRVVEILFPNTDGTPHIVNGANDGHHIFKIKGLENAGGSASRSPSLKKT